MANIWSRLRGNSAEERLSVQDWANMFSFNGNTYPIGMGSMQRGSNHEAIDNDFTGYVNGAYKANGAVFACMQARMLVFTEMRFQYQKLNQGRPGDLFGSKELALLEKPWPNGTTGELLARAIQDADLAGNHYVVREGAGPNARLRRLRPDWVDIILTAPPDKAVQSDVKGYLYKPGGTDDKTLWKVYPIDGSKGAVAHWSPIPDPSAQYRGMSWLTPVLREVMADKSAAQHKLKFFENAATPNLAVSFKETVTNQQFTEFMEAMDKAKSGVEHAYETLYLGGGADVTVIGANMQQMDFKVITGQNENRIAAAARVPVMLVGFDDGSRGAVLGDTNLKAAKDLFGSGTLRPLWRSLCTAYEVLVAEFEGARLWYDDRDIAFLRQDRLDVAAQQEQEASTIAQLIMNGFTPDSVKLAITQGDWRLLEHTGLFSVQLMPPGMVPGNANDPNTGPANKPEKPGKDAKAPAAQTTKKGAS